MFVLLSVFAIIVVSIALFSSLVLCITFPINFVFAFVEVIVAQYGCYCGLCCRF